MPATIEAPATSSPNSLGEAVMSALAKSNAVIPESAPEPKAEPAKPAAKVEKSAPQQEPKPDATTGKEPASTELENPNLTPEKPEAKADTKPAKEEELPKGMTKEAQQSFAEKRRALAAAEKQIEAFASEREAYEAKLKEAAASAPEVTKLKSELEALRQQLADNENEISITRVESTRQYKEAVAAPMAEVDSIVARLAQTYELAPDAILAAFRETDPTKRADAIEDITASSGFKAYDRDEMILAARSFTKAQKIGDEMRSNAKTKLEEITASTSQEQEREALAKSEQYRAGISKEWKALQARYPQLRAVEGKQEWNDYLARIERDAQAVDVNQLGAEEVARHVAQSRALPELARVVDHYQKREKDLTAKLEAAEARIKEYVGTEPGAGAGRGGESRASEVNAGGTMGERVMARARG